jgi:hypothetical protein
MIFRLVPPRKDVSFPATDFFLAYVQRFEIVPQYRNLTMPSPRGPYPDPVTNMYVMKCSIRAGGSRMGDIIPLTNLRAAADLIPHWNEKADKHLTKETSVEYSRHFYLNKFFDKDMFYALDNPPQ